MSVSTLQAQVEVLRRIAERALSQAQETAPSMVDVLQHFVDEAKRTEAYAENMSASAQRSA